MWGWKTDWSNYAFILISTYIVRLEVLFAILPGFLIFSLQYFFRFYLIFVQLYFVLPHKFTSIKIFKLNDRQQLKFAQNLFLNAMYYCFQVLNNDQSLSCTKERSNEWLMTGIYIYLFYCCSNLNKLVYNTYMPTITSNLRY